MITTRFERKSLFLAVLAGLLLASVPAVAAPAAQTGDEPTASPNAQQPTPQPVAKAGLQSKFAGGTLLCPGGTVLTHSDGDNRLVMEGAVNADFFKVRKLVHDTYYIS